MKSTLLAVAAVLALGSASAYAQTAGVEPSFNDEADVAPMTITGKQMVDQHLPKGSFNSGGPRGPATMVRPGVDRNSAQYAGSSASTGASRSGATVDGKVSHNTDPTGLPPTLNDTFSYPAY
jgi:hypothetical protein